MGATGSGKTFSITTLLEAGLEVFVICTEPTGMDTLLDAIKSKGLSTDKLHWRAITPARPTFQGLTDLAKKVAVLDFEGLAKLKPSGNRQEAQWIKVLTTLANFTDDKDGKVYGDVTKFGPDKALVVDSLSGLNLMAMDLVIGDKATAHMGEWGVAMQLIEKLLLTLSSSLNCVFVLNAHLEREVNEITGGSSITASTLGRKLAPRLPRFFSEVVMAYREGGRFYWSTDATGVDLKHRALPLGNKLDPTFAAVVLTFRERIKTSTGTKEVSTKPA